MQTERKLARLITAVAGAAMLLPVSQASAATTSPFRTAVEALDGINMYGQFDGADTASDHFGSFAGYANTVGGGLMNPAGGGFQQPGWGTVPNFASSAPGVPLDGIADDDNYAMQNRPTSIPNGGPGGQLYASIGFRAQPDPEAPEDPQNELTPFYAGAWVRSFANAHAGANANFDDINQVIISRRPFVGDGSGEGIDNIPGEDGWHLFMRNDDANYGGTGKLTWQMGDGSNLINFESSVDLFADDWWHFVAFSYNGDPTDPNALSLYVDGSPVATTYTVPQGSAASMFIVSSGAAWQVAVGNSGGKNNIWDGPIDETFMGFGELSASDVSDLWTAANIPDAPPVLVPGDADGDGDVDLDDFDILTANYGQQGFGGSSIGDFDNNGRVNFTDFIIQAQNMPFGGPDEAISSLPEPATLTLLCLGGLSVMRRRHH